MGVFDALPQGTLAGRIISHRNFYLLGICFVLGGLSWSNVVMSIGQFILLGNWLLEGNYKEKFKRLWANKAACLIIAFLLLHMIGLLWSADLDYGIKDIRIKLPLLLIPFVLSSSRPLTIEQFKWLLHFFVFSIFITTVFSYGKYFGVNGSSISDKRELAIRISHIRYGLMIVFAFFCALYFGLKNKKYRFLYYLLAIYFLGCLLLFQFYSGLAVFFLISCFLLIRSLFHTEYSIFRKLFAAFVLLILIGVPSVIFYQVYKEFTYVPKQFAYDQDDFKAITESGNPYQHHLDLKYTENGYYVWRFISEDELRKEWNSSSELDYDGKDLKGQALRSTLFRYLTSLGLKKDSAGFSKLTERDVNAVEKGVANYYLATHNRLKGRIHSTLYEINNYRKHRLAEGFSVAMRFEYWHLAFEIIEENPYFGVGTGDIQQAFNQKYQSGESVLNNEEYWRRSHNQYLSTWIQLGLPGLLLLLTMFFYPLFQRANHKSFLFMVFIALICLSMLTEDTLETQAGATLCSIFFSLFLVNPKP